MAKKNIRVKDLLIEPYHKVLDDVLKEHKYSWIILTSGRAGAKSSGVSIIANTKIVSDPECAGIILRKRHNKLRKTVYREFLRAISRMGISKKRAYKITKSPMEITYKKNGNTVYFTGSDSVDDTKGIIDEEKPIKFVVLDELTEFFDDGEGEDELNNIEATFVRGNDGEFVMIAMFNPPKNPSSPIMKWVEKMEQREDVLHIHTDYRDVPPSWIGQKLIHAAEMLKAIDEKMYRWVWLGLCTGVDEAIYYMFGEKHKRKPPQKSYNTIIIGGDYGQQNATTFQAFGLDNDITHPGLDGLAEFYHSGRDTGKQKSPSEYAIELKKMIEGLHEKYSCGLFYVVLDPSAKGLKEECKRVCRSLPYNVIFKDEMDDRKGKLNDVARGISRVQKLLTYELIHFSPTQQNLISEMQTYEYDKKKLELGQEVPVKTDDHAPDAIRYAVMFAWSKIKHFLPEVEREDNK